MPRTPHRATRVSTLELLLDLVFVVTVGQLARTVADDVGWVAIGQAAVLMAVVWWMYAAFAWLTNQAVPDTTPVRVLLIAAMAAFLVLSLAIPTAFGHGAVVFGCAYVAVAVIHGGLFIARGGASGAAAMVRVTPLNVLIGVAMAGAGLATGAWRWTLVAVALGLIVAGASIGRRTPFDLVAEHFVERHGLLTIIALGESVVSVTASVHGGELDAGTVVGGVLVVAVIAALWWCYFVGDDERASVAFSAVDVDRRAGAALRAFYVDHGVMLFGLVLLGAGFHLSLEAPFEPPGVPVGLLAGVGVALFLLADVDYRRYLGLGTGWWRAAAAATCAAVGLLGARLDAAVLVGGLALVLAVALVAEARTARPEPAEA
ncbi:low temperature requirement protein A [Cellulomonas alba]|uniref:Low temperature requirement protein A n=1 Tax=Cellulomonas alba TaxID=3053467 RepID=A0ABT7SH27_9CELL|nr:low temperature requirement protein A [Cellulomonas alba]MDM7854834.1 low temperature requirement protein A [Cellulomonas alba]